MGRRVSSLPHTGPVPFASLSSLCLFPTSLCRAYAAARVIIGPTHPSLLAGSIVGNRTALPRPPPTLPRFPPRWQGPDGRLTPSPMAMLQVKIVAAKELTEHHGLRACYMPGPPSPPPSLFLRTWGRAVNILPRSCHSPPSSLLSQGPDRLFVYFSINPQFMAGLFSSSGREAMGVRPPRWRRLRTSFGRARAGSTSGGRPSPSRWTAIPPSPSRSSGRSTSRAPAPSPPRRAPPPLRPLLPVQGL